MNEKIDTQLSLALSFTEKELEQSPELRAGYDPFRNQWELIIRYVGDGERIRTFTNQQLITLEFGYGIVYLEEDRIDAFAQLPEVIYIEKPKNLHLEVARGIAASCILQVKSGNINLNGNGTLIAVLDTGIDIYHPDFINPDGSSKIAILWDQELNQIYDANQINDALVQGRTKGDDIVVSRDFNGHGTHVASICGGINGVANEAQLVIVKLSAANNRGFPRTTQLMRGLEFVISYARDQRKPIAINISYGNHYGDHRGSSLLERYVSDMANAWKSVICIGTGNEGDTGRHYQNILKEELEVRFAIAPAETSLNLQLWKNYEDEFDVYLTSPSGITRKIPMQDGSNNYMFEDTKVSVYYGSPVPYRARQEIYFSFLPMDTFIIQGEWILRLVPVDVKKGDFYMWLPVSSGTNRQTRFLQPSLPLTLTVPSTANGAIGVGAYNSGTLEYASFSGRGDSSICVGKPDLAAPGVGIAGASVGGGTTVMSGTSMATPFVTGSAALLMEWGIVKGNDPYLYGEKVKAYLSRGARQLPWFDMYPNNQIGWGTLCVNASLP